MTVDILASLKRAQAAIRARERATTLLSAPPGWTWRALITTHSGRGGGGLLDGHRPTRFWFTPEVDELVATRLVGVPVRRYRDPARPHVWTHPPNANAPHAEHVVGVCVSAWPAPDGAGVEGDLRITDGQLHRELLAIERAGRLRQGAAVSLAAKYRGEDGEPGPHGITIIDVRPGCDYTVYAIDVVNQRPGCAGAGLLRFVGESEGG